MQMVCQWKKRPWSWLWCAPANLNTGLDSSCRLPIRRSRPERGRQPALPCNPTSEVEGRQCTQYVTQLGVQAAQDNFFIIFKLHQVSIPPSWALIRDLSFHSRKNCNIYACEIDNLVVRGYGHKVNQCSRRIYRLTKPQSYISRPRDSVPVPLTDACIE